jgi:predicted TPR repeat methyltransferase
VRERLEREYFEGLYAESKDPWDYESSDYEQRKYQKTLQALGGRRFTRALEVGSSIGVFTELLAPLCDELIALDLSERAVAAARQRLSGHEQVRVQRRGVPEEMSEGPFDLILASEVLYFLTREVMLAALEGFERELAPCGLLLAVHWRKETKTYPLQGDEVHELLMENTQLKHIENIIEPEYRLDLFENRS